jgi:hypothetical protein
MKKLLLFVVFNVLLVLGIHAQCTIHFVTTSGTPSGAGTMADPIDLETVFTIAANGDIIRIGEGTRGVLRRPRPRFSGRPRRWANTRARF